MINQLKERSSMLASRVSRTETARKFLTKELEKLSDHERAIVQRFIERGRTARNVAREFEDQLTLGQKIADRVAEIMGSWTFIIVQSTVLAAWIVLNIVAYMKHWDPYPFILLNLGLSFQAAYAAPIIMMSQNRQAQKDRMQSTNDYEVDMKAEMEIMQLHEKFNELRDSYWADLVRMQQQQIEMLERIIQTVASAGTKT
jgi:uncharacterized membrane protein